MIASDIDGTILDYFASPGAKPVLNQALVREWRRLGVKQVAFCTNQGGLAFGLAGYKRADGRTYPQPEHCLWRLQSLKQWLWQVGITVPEIRVSLFYDYATGLQIDRAARQLYKLLETPQFAGFGSGIVIYTTARARKPSGLMLHSVQAEVFYGDSEDDRGAALAAGVPFVQVERFVG